MMSGAAGVATGGAYCSDKRKQMVSYAGQEYPRCSGLLLLLLDCAVDSFCVLLPALTFV